jgi:hypothetical protein
MRKANKLSFRWFLLCLATTCFGQTQPMLCPKHIETPAYPPLARATRLMRKVALTLGLDAEGNVENVEAITENPMLLKESAVENIKHWTFAKPPSIPFKRVIIYDYEFDASLPGDNGTNPITRGVTPKRQ